MKIEKMITHEGDSYHITRSKINEIINKINNEKCYAVIEKFNEFDRKINELQTLVTNLYMKNNNSDGRLSDLEQCPVNDVKQCQPHKSYDEEMRDIGLTLIEIIKKNYDPENKKKIPKPDYDHDDVKFKEKSRLFSNSEWLDKIEELEGRIFNLEQCPVNDNNNYIKEMLDCHKEKLENIYDYINYFKNERCSMDELCKHSSDMQEAILSRLDRLEERTIPKPDYDVAFQSKEFIIRNDEKLSKETWVCRPGTFEWALIQMKNGKAVFRYKKEYGRYFLRPSTVLNCLAVQVDGCDTKQWEPVTQQILATDWQVIDETKN